jgi:UDP:flavonoid glycosyltransferase YjiC (YdhE family)
MSLGALAMTAYQSLLLFTLFALPERLMQSDQRVLKTINAAMETLSAEPLQRVSEVFEGSKHFLTTFAELDPYRSRSQARYLGPTLGPQEGAIPEWPQGRGPKVFGYLKSHYQPMEEVLGALAAFECRTAAFVAGLSAQTLAKVQNTTISVSPIPYDIKRAASECDFGVTHAGHGTTCQLLLMGRPLLLLPMQLEQYLTARGVCEVGAGVIEAQENPRSNFKAAVGQMINNPELGRRAKDFASRYSSFSSRSTVATIANECEAIVRNSRAGIVV